MKDVSDYDIDRYDASELSNIVSTKTVPPSADLFDSFKNLDNICQILENFLLIFRSKPYRKFFNNSSINWKYYNNKKIISNISKCMVWRK